MSIKPTPRVFFAVICSLLFFTFLFYFSRKSTDKTLEKITIAQTSDFFLYAPVYIAIDRGFFKSNGIDANLVTTGGDDKSWAAVLSGDAMFAVSDPTFVAISSANGKPGRVVASIVNGVPFWGVTLKKDLRKISSPAELKSYSVATFPSPSTAYTLQKKMFLDAGLTPNIKEGQFGTLLAMLKAKQADIALELEPNVSQAQSEGANVLYSLASVYGDFSITGITTTPQNIADHPETIRRVIKSLQESLNFIHSNPGGAATILLKRFPEIQPSVANSALKRILEEGIIPNDLRTSDKAWTKAIQLREMSGDIKSPKSITEYIDNTFADKVNNK